MPALYIKTKKRGRKKYVKALGVFLILIGIVCSFYFFFPVLSYEIFLSKNFAKGDLEIPIPKREIVKGSFSLGSLVGASITSLISDFTDARNWYPGLARDTKTHSLDKYFMSIPKLRIENAEISTKDYDLTSHLVQYFGTSIPGERGTAVIFGHSTLPHLFDSKNYKTIFATLHTIKIGDEIFTTVNGLTYKYKIFSIVITDPEDTNMFSQSFDNSYITLVTCTPPGTTWKRLIVRATLDSINN